MFLKKLFKSGKDYNHYLEKGDRFLADERFADARNAYLEALEKIGAGGGEDVSLTGAVRVKIAQTGNMLGRLNLVEAQHAIAGGDGKKAAEHLRIIMDLADDPALREESERLLAGLDSEPPRTAYFKPIHNCVTCGGREDEAEVSDRHAVDGDISGEDRLTLYFQTLPGELSERYAGMGKEFARGCLLNLEGKECEALAVFEELSAASGNDILAYEKAIIYFHNGDHGKCEQLLQKSLDLNPANPLSNIGLVQLYIETGRGAEAMRVLERMIANGVMPEQALLMQGDLYSFLLDEPNAVECYSKLLASPKFAREAAERLVPILESQGRTREAAYLVKRFAKGCC